MKAPTTLSVQETYQNIRNMIASKELIGGERIVYETLFQKLKVDQKTVRKALKILQTYRLIIEVPDEGLVVRDFSYTDILEIFNCRIALETMAIKQFTLSGSQARIDDLRNLLAPFEKGPLSAKIFQKIDFHFHDIILANCGNQCAYQLFDKGNLWLCMQVIGLKRPLGEILQEHLDMVSEIHSRDAERAVLLMRNHLQNSKHVFLS